MSKALARAVYSRKSIVVLDDPLSALDSKTETAIFSSLLGENGLLRNGETTVIMTTNAGMNLLNTFLLYTLTFQVHHLPAADKIVALDSNGRVRPQKSFNEIRNEYDIEGVLGTSPGVQERKPSPPPSSADQFRPKAKNSLALVSEKERARRTGDLSCYFTYGQSMGYTRVWIFLVIAIFFAFSSRFSRKPLHAESISNLTVVQRFGSSGSQTTSPSTECYSSAYIFCWL